MLYSQEYNFLFIHIPKTGGTSLVSILKDRSDRVPLPLRGIGYFLDNRGISLPAWSYSILGFPYHITAEALRNYWGNEEFDRYFKFAFVRNPWDLVLSEYKYILTKPSHPLHRKISRSSSLDDFLEWKLSIWKNSRYARPQSAWLFDSAGNNLINYVGRFENYEENSTAIMRKLGIETEIPHLNATKHSPYLENYSNHGRKLVETMYAEDIDHFNYHF